jgi:succinate dehydrogenase/fumarate reductase flavoprotein subunit
MTYTRIVDKVIDTDVLVIGGGMGGCPAAYKAAEHGLRVTLVEKAKVERAGHAAAGMDTVMDFVPKEMKILDFLKMAQEREEFLYGPGRTADANLLHRIITSAWWALGEMEKMGLPMKWDDGSYHFVRNLFFANKVSTMMVVHFLEVKPLMGKAVRQKGVNVLDRTMIVDLLTHNGRVVGATAINTRTSEFTVIKAKAVIAATAALARAFEAETPQFYKYKMKYHGAPGAVSGDSWAFGYRAGAELANMDIGNCWNYRIRDDITMDMGTLTHGDGVPGKVMTWKGDLIPALTIDMYDKIERNGLDPVYLSMANYPDDYQKRAEVSLADERMISLKMAEDRGFNPKAHRFEQMANKPHNFATAAGLTADENFKTTLPGLFVIGDSTAGLSSCGYAMISGFYTGEHMPEYLNSTPAPVVDEAQVESQKEAALAPLAEKDGTEPMELECAVRYICERYVSIHKSEGKLLEGLRRLGSLRRVFLPKLMAKNPHYLMRCQEARNVMDLAELHIQACLARKESRGYFYRTDYQERDPARDSMATYQRLEDGKPVLEIRRVPELKPEYLKEGK